MVPEEQTKLDLVQARIQSIPEKWRLCKVVDVLHIRNNMRKPISQDERDKIQGAYPYYGPTKIQDWISTFEQDGTYALIGEDGDHFLKFHKTPQTQIVTGKCTINNHAHIIESSASCDSEWFYFYFRNRNIINFLSRQGAGRFKLNKAALEKLPLLVPPLPEQRKIAKILQTWDRAIATTEKLIDASKKQKKALMQQLLTGKKRFAGFEGEWARIELNELLDYTQPTAFIVQSTKYDDKFDIPVLTAGKTFVLGYTSEESGIYKDNLPAIIFDDFTTASHYVDFPFKVKSSAMKILTAKNDYPLRFVFEAMQRLDFSVGGHQRHWISIFSRLVISVPDKTEAQQISTALNTANIEIAILRKKLDALKQEKKALMQQLLTGKRRVKVDE